MLNLRGLDQMKNNLNVTIDQYLINTVKFIAKLKGWSVSYIVNLALEAVCKEVFDDYIKQWEAEDRNTKELAQ